MSQALAETPKYKVLHRTFIEPDTLEPGTVIYYNGLPGPHLEPLNEGAVARMEEFFTERFPERDPRTKELTGKMIAAREVLRTKKPEDNIHHGVTVLALPEETPTEKMMSLGELMAVRKPTDARPGPAVIPQAIAVKTPEERKT